MEAGCPNRPVEELPAAGWAPKENPEGAVAFVVVGFGAPNKPVDGAAAPNSGAVAEVVGA